jgi:sterol desaturase/sphingolipid hydroxylase (fatty acid hydroxylase superfamily)
MFGYRALHHNKEKFCGKFIAWAEFNHPNLKLNLRFPEPVFITPRLHKVHHVAATLESNLGTIFTFWDRLRITFVRADPGEGSPRSPVFGNGEANYPQTWATQLVEPIRRLARLRRTSN